MRLFISFILILMMSCTNQSSVVNEGNRINLNDFGNYIEIVDDQYGGTLMINLGFFDEIIYIKKGVGLNSTSTRILNSGIDVYDSSGQKIGMISSGGGYTISSDVLDGSIYEFKKTYSSGGTYLIEMDGERVGSVRIHDERRISIILYREVNFDILIHSIYYLE